MALLAASQFVLLAVWFLACAFFDFTQRRLPNVLTLGIYIPAFAVLLVSQQTAVFQMPVMAAVYGWLLALVLTLPAYVFRWLGAGDVKMLTGLGMLTGWQFMLTNFVLAGFLSGLVVLLWLFSQRLVPYFNLHLAKRHWQLPAVPVLTGKKLPFGGFIAIGGLGLLSLHLLQSPGVKWSWLS